MNVWCPDCEQDTVDHTPDGSFCLNPRCGWFKEVPTERNED